MVVSQNQIGFMGGDSLKYKTNIRLGLKILVHCYSFTKQDSLVLSRTRTIHFKAGQSKIKPQLLKRTKFLKEF